jgi:Domain of unknown function (DUF4439)
MTLLESLQAALAVEHQVVYGYGVLGPRLSGATKSYAADCLSAHMAHRDALEALVSAARATPAVAAPAYQLPFRVSDPDAARRLAVRLEQASAGATWDLIVSSSAGDTSRTAAVGWLSDAAIRLDHWGAELALPGQPD